MLPLFLALALLPQDPSRGIPSSRNLPDDRTLCCLEVPVPDRILRLQDSIFQIRLLKLPIVKRATEMAVAQNVPARLWQRREDLVDILRSFDRGISVANLFPPEKRGPGGPVLSGCARARLALTKQPERILSILNAGTSAGQVDAHEGPVSLEVDESPLADTPVLASWIRLEPREKEGQHPRWHPRPGLAFAYKGRHAAFYSESDVGEDSKNTAFGFLSEVLGLELRSKARRPLGSPGFVPGQQEQLIGSFELRFGEFRDNEAITSDRQRKEMDAMGLGSFVGVRTHLLAGPSGMRDRIELHDGGAERSVFRILAGSHGGLGAAAEHLPGSTLAALRLGLNGKALSDYLHRVAESGGEQARMESIIRQVRLAAGLATGPDDADTSLRGLDEIIAFVLPPASGSPIAEPGVMIRVPPKPREIRSSLETFARLFARDRGNVSVEEAPAKIHSHGKGEQRVLYLRYRDFYPFELGSRYYGFKFLGGGFLSIVRVGPYLVFGCNPKSLRGFREQVRQKRTLAVRKGFLERFPKTPDRPLEAWFDLPSMASRMGAASLLLPWFLMMAPVGGAQMGMGMTFASLGTTLTGRQFLTILREETLVLSKTDYGHLLEQRGGTTLSPTAWIGFAYLAYYMDNLASLIR